MADTPATSSGSEDDGPAAIHRRPPSIPGTPKRMTDSGRMRSESMSQLPHATRSKFPGSPVLRRSLSSKDMPEGLRMTTSTSSPPLVMSSPARTPPVPPMRDRKVQSPRRSLQLNAFIPSTILRRSFAGAGYALPPSRTSSPSLNSSRTTSRAPSESSSGSSLDAPGSVHSGASSSEAPRAAGGAGVRADNDDDDTTPATAAAAAAGGQESGDDDSAALRVWRAGTRTFLPTGPDKPWPWWRLATGEVVLTTALQHDFPDKVVDGYGFMHDAAHAQTHALEAPQEIAADEATWQQTLETWPQWMGNRKHRRLLRRRIQERGVAFKLRGRVWMLMSGALRLLKTHAGVFNELVTAAEMLPADDEVVSLIDRDVPRSYPDHVGFARDSAMSALPGTPLARTFPPGMCDLRRVLLAFVMFDPRTGYCQGMNRLAGLFLMFVPPEEAFWLLVASMERDYVKGYYSAGLEQMQIDSAVFHRALKRHFPELAAHLGRENVHPLAYTVNWFMSMFTMALPWSSVLRTWDMFLFEGWPALQRVGLAIAAVQLDALLKLTAGANGNELAVRLQHPPPALVTPDALVAAFGTFTFDAHAAKRDRAELAEMFARGDDIWEL